MPTPVAVPPELATLTEYADLRPLGQGGMGAVFAGTQVLMNRPVVLKVMTADAAGADGAAERFLREIRAAAALDHPNVVKAYAAHRVGQRLVFVMEYVAGDDLAKVVTTRGPLPVANAAYFTYQAALGLQHAHERGLVHRDIKPGNLLVAKAFGKTVVKVADFGLAKAAREREADARLTSDGRLMGTPHFLAPEQALDAASADIRADVYSLGCTLYYLLAGRTPYDGRSLVAIIDAHRSTVAPSLAQLRPEVPAELAAVAARMMAKNPADRFQTPGDAARELVPFFKPGGTAATPVAVKLDPLAPKSSPGMASRPAPVTAVPHDTPSAAASPASHWKPPTVFRGSDVPHDTAYLNAEDFNPAAGKPPKPPRKKKQKSPLPVAPLVGMAVAVAAIVVGGVAALVALSPKQTAATSPTGGEPPVSEIAASPKPAGFVPLLDAKTWRPDPLHRGTWGVRDGVLSLAGGPVPDDKKAEFPSGLLVTDRADFGDVRVRLTYRRTRPEAFCQLHLRASAAKPSPEFASSYLDGVGVSLGGVTGPGNPRPPGSLLAGVTGNKANWLAAPGTNPTGDTTLEVELAGDTVRTFDAAGNLLLDLHLPAPPPPGRLGLWTSAGAGLEVLRFEVMDLPPRPTPPAGPLVFGDTAPDLPPKLRIARHEFERDDPATAGRNYGTAGGKYVITGDKARGTGWNVNRITWDPALAGDGNYALEAVGRATGGPSAKWGIHLTYRTAESGKEWSAYVRLSADGEVAVLPGWFAKPQLPPAPLSHPARHPAVATGAVDNRLMAVQVGNDLWVYVNGRRAAGPVRLPADLRPPMTMALTSQDSSEIAVDRLTVWGLPADTVVSTAQPGQAATPPTGLPAAGFEPLFNGRDKTGWAVVPGTADNWTVENGVLVGRGGEKASHLFCDRTYSDFHLRAEYRVNPVGNSGVYFRATQTAGERYPAGYEAQINHASPSGGPPTGSLYLSGVIAAQGGPVSRADEWTTLEVIAAGAQVTVKVNDVTTSAFTASAGHPTRGRIALQHHNPQTVVEFRKLEIKEPDPAPARPAAPTRTSSPAPKSDPPKPKGFAGAWTGTWVNSGGYTGADTLELKADGDRRYSGAWSNNVKLSGQAFSPDTMDLKGRHEGKNYAVTALLKGDTLTLKYTVSDDTGKPLYAGQSSLKRK